MKRPENQDEFYELLGSLCNDSITPDQYAILETLLKSDKRARRLYLDYIDVHLELSNAVARGEHQLPFGQLKQELDRITEGSSAASTIKPSARKPSRWPKGLTYFLIMAATVLGMLGIQHLLVQSDSKKNSPDSVAANLHEVPEYVATLLKSVDCKWSGENRPQFDGQRLLSKEVWLEEGLAELGFDSGVRIVLQGPVRFSIDSPSKAVLHSGSLVLQGHDSAAPFELLTPHSTLLDVGTEYGASVGNDETTDIHVFSGEVTVNPRGDTQPFAQRSLGEGQAIKINRRGVLPATVNDANFVRKIPESALVKQGASKQLLATESFDYETPTIAHAYGGQGFQGEWRSVIGSDQPAMVRIHQAGSLPKGQHSSKVSDSNSLELVGSRTVTRTLESPIRLDIDAVYYVSFLVKRVKAAPRGESQYFSFSFRTADSPKDPRKLHFGMTSESHPTMTHSDREVIVAPPLPVGETSMFVAKIIAGKDDPDQLMLRVYGPNESVRESETLIWNCVTPAQLDDTVFDQMLLFAGSSGHFLVDEIRIGTNWESVTSYALDPAEKQ